MLCQFEVRNDITDQPTLCHGLRRVTKACRNVCFRRATKTSGTTDFSSVAVGAIDLGIADFVLAILIGSVPVHRAQRPSAEP